MYPTLCPGEVIEQSRRLQTVQQQRHSTQLSEGRLFYAVNINKQICCRGTETVEREVRSRQTMIERRWKWRDDRGRFPPYASLRLILIPTIPITTNPVINASMNELCVVPSQSNLANLEQNKKEKRKTRSDGGPNMADCTTFPALFLVVFLVSLFLHHYYYLLFNIIFMILFHFPLFVLTLSGCAVHVGETAKQPLRQYQPPPSSYSKAFSGHDRLYLSRSWAGGHRIGGDDATRPPMGPLYPRSSKDPTYLRAAGHFVGVRPPALMGRARSVSRSVF